MTLKEMLDAVMLESGLTTSTAYIGASDDATLRLVNLANRSAVMLSTGYNWQALRTSHLFTLTTDTEYDLPTDFRALIADTGFADSYIWPVDFVTDPSLWAYLKSSTAAVGPR